MSNTDLDIVKKAHTKSAFTEKTMLELVQCVEDPLYFMRNFMKIQHPIKGALPFEPYPFQLDIIKAFHDNRFTIALTARQMGKCLVSNTNIQKDGESINIGSLVNQGFKQKLVSKLEKWLIDLKSNTRS